MANAAQVWTAIQGAMQATATETRPSLDLDLSALVELDSSVIALILQTLRGALSRGCAVRVHKAPQRLFDLARLYGVEDLLPRV